MVATRSGVLVCGSINTDLVARVHRAPEAGETVTGSEFNIFGGGKGANQALAVARSEVRTIMLGAVGADEFGRQRLADLRADGVDTESVVVTNEAVSGVALIVVDDTGENRISYVPGATATIRPDQAVAAYRRASPALLLSTLELPIDTLAALYQDARADGVRVIVNATPEPASGRELLSSADVLIVNETEAAELLGGTGTDDWPTVAANLSEFGPAWVVITLGAEGAIARFDGRNLRLPAPTMTVVDTTGAGDAFCGAFAAELVGGDDAESALRAGVAAGSLAVTVAGAQRSMPRRHDVERQARDFFVQTF